MENLQNLIGAVYDVCQLDVAAQKKDSQLMVAWPPLSLMTQTSVCWSAIQTRPNCLYIHIPFCTGICTYCNYVTKSIDPGSNEISVYLGLLQQESEILCRCLQVNKIKVDSVYIGGGTPSVLGPKDLEKLLDIVDQYFLLSSDAEFTFEGCPETLDADKLTVLRGRSVNRISIGVETFDDTILSSVNRRHDAKQVARCIEQIEQHGFLDFDIDLINNLPGSTPDTVTRDCHIATTLQIPSITLYHYHVKPKSIDYKKTPKQQYLDIKRREIMLHELYRSALTPYYDEYMIDWYSRGDLRFRHQLLKWQHDANQLTLGAGCYGYYEGTQFRMHKSTVAYRDSVQNQTLPIMNARTLTDNEIDKRKFLFRLRQSRSIGPKAFGTQEHAMIKLRDLGLLAQNGDYFLITDVGALFFDEIQRLLAE